MPRMRRALHWNARTRRRALLLELSQSFRLVYVSAVVWGREVTLRVKTLWFMTKLDADVVDATVTNLDQLTMYAETNSRTFRSLQVWVKEEDISTVTGATVAEHRLGLRFAAAAYTTITELDDITHSSENMSGVIGPFDFTAQAVSNFGAGVSQTCDIQVYFDISTGTGLNVRNVCALFALTYEFDDAAATQYASLLLPMESAVGALPTTETELGTNQIPQLTGAGGLLENVASVIVRQQFYLVKGNDESASATDYTVNIRIDTGTTKTFTATEKALISDAFKWFLYQEAPAAGAVHAFKIWTTGIGALHHCAVTMYVTFEFAVSGTTRFCYQKWMNYEMSSPLGGTAAADSQRFSRTFFIEEPGTITLKQSAYTLNFEIGRAAMAGLNSRAGSQAYRAYTNGAAMVCGGEIFQQRIDSGSAQGAGITIARGQNTITIDAYRTDATDLGWNLSGRILVTYTSDVPSGGIWAGEHITVWPVLGWDAALATERISASVAPIIPEANWFATEVGFWMVHWDAAANNGIVFHAENLAGEGAADGWRDLYADVFVKDAERGCQIIMCRARSEFQRFPTDQDGDRLALETSRRYRYSNTATCAKGVVMILSYHSISYTVTGTISGSGGGTVTIVAHSKLFEEKIGETSRVGNGTYSITWYDNTSGDIVVEALEFATLVGRSDDGAPT